MPRPKKDENKKRVRITITTLPEVLTAIDKYRGYMTRSEFIHRRIVDWYNEHPENKQIRYWEPDNKG